MSAARPTQTTPPWLRCPTNRENSEIRVFTVAGSSGSSPDLCLQTFRRLSHDLSAPWGPSGAAIRLPLRFADRLIEIIQHLARTPLEPGE